MNIVSWEEVLLRLGLAALFGFIIGLDRDKKNKPIDFRAYMIVAATTCVVAILSQELYAHYADAEKVISLDLTRIISGVLVGTGFLGAGAIIKVSDKEVIGTATGASIWASGVIGLCLGFGFYGLSVAAFAAVGLTLVLFGYFMKVFMEEADKIEESD